MAKTASLVIVRHGESELNKTDQFAGWLDPGLTPKGVEEAKRVGQTLKAAAFMPDIVYVSPLKRTQDTATIALKEMGQDIKPVVNQDIIERFYGGLTGLNRVETKAKFGEEKFLEYRRSYDTPPPPIDASHPDYEMLKAKFGEKLPASECLKDVVARVQRFWDEVLSKDLKAGKKVLISAHGNSLRALVMLLRKMTPEDVKNFEVHRAEPVEFTFDADTLKVISEKPM
ncbi:MAG: 2,3-diphosphoglycerate-dependent phosphoglycerate mutase [Rickettsiales bacterium]